MFFFIEKRAVFYSLTTLVTHLLFYCDYILYVNCYKKVICVVSSNKHSYYLLQLLTVCLSLATFASLHGFAQASARSHGQGMGRLGGSGAAKLISSLDPDAPVRQKKALNDLDQV